MVKVLGGIDNEIKLNIEKCLSSSNVCGRELREAHYYLGCKLGLYISSKRRLIKRKIAVLIMMRAGLPFGFGVADSLDRYNDVTVLFSTSENDFSSFEIVIIADAVVNTGKTILEIINKMDNRNVVIATNVISDKHRDNLKDVDIFSIRVSQHSYKGTTVKFISNGKGPDTGDRLFNNSFYK